MRAFPASIRPLAAAAWLMLAAPLAQAQLANVSPVFLDYGLVKMGATVTVPLTIQNPNAFALTLAGGGFNTANGFSAGGGTCAGSVAANSSCTLSYRFRPLSATQTVENSTSLLVGGNGQSQFFPLAFRGTGSESLVQVSPRGIDFGEELIGETVTVPVTITNTHSALVSLAGGGIGSPFGGIGGSPSCSGGIAPGASCQINYRFTPGQIDEVSGATSIQASASGNLSQFFSIELRGRGRSTAGIIGVVPVGLDFGDIKLGTQVESRIFATNRTANALSRAGGGFNDNDNAFSGVGGGDAGCGGGAHPAGATCSSRYFFLPRERREHAASTSVSFSQPGNSVFVSYQFTGTGVGTLARVSPVEIDFGAIRVGNFVTVPVTVLNTSAADLTNFLGGNVTGVFSRTTNCGSTLAVGASCQLTYRFQPQSPVESIATTLLSYTNSTGTQETVEINLSGEGVTRVFADGFE